MIASRNKAAAAALKKIILPYIDPSFRGMSYPPA